MVGFTRNFEGLRFSHDTRHVVLSPNLAPMVACLWFWSDGQCICVCLLAQFNIFVWPIHQFLLGPNGGLPWPKQKRKIPAATEDPRPPSRGVFMGQCGAQETKEIEPTHLLGAPFFLFLRTKPLDIGNQKSMYSPGYKGTE